MIDKDKVEQVFDGKFIRVFDLKHKPGKHYMDATRRTFDDLVATKTKEEYLSMLPDAVSIVAVIEVEGDEPKLLLQREFRYPAGQYILSVPAGLIDKADKEEANPLLATTRREIKEETGLDLCDEDEFKVLSPLLFSTPGFTDESNALVKVTVKRDSIPKFTDQGAESTEMFDGVFLLSKTEAKELLARGTEADGMFYSVFTFMALTSFIYDL